MKSKPEDILFNQDGCLIEIVSPKHIGTMGSWPSDLIHFTDNPKDAEAIKRNGFTLKYCGRSAKKYNVADEYRWDPCGIYAITDEGYRNGGSPFVHFTAYIETALYYNRRDLKLGSPCGKRVISEIFGNKTGRALRISLLKSGIEAVFSDLEQIILDPGFVEVSQ